MKQKLIELLTTKFGVGAKVVEGIAEKLSKTVSTEEEAATAVEGVNFQQVLESYADKRANEASETARKNAIKAYEDKYGLKDGIKAEDPAKAAEEAAKKAAEEAARKKAEEEAAAAAGKSEKKEDEVPAYIKALQAQIEAMNAANTKQLETITSLQNEIIGIKTAKTLESRQSLLQKEISKLTAIQQKPYARIALDSMTDEEFNTFLEETKTDVASIEKDNKAAAAAASAQRPFMGNILTDGKKASDAELKDVVDKIL